MTSDYTVLYYNRFVQGQRGDLSVLTIEADNFDDAIAKAEALDWVDAVIGIANTTNGATLTAVRQILPIPVKPTHEIGGGVRLPR